MKYVALLRGINVGGRNIIKMADLKSVFEKYFEHVITYIQSGNVIFESTERNQSKLEQAIETFLSKEFEYSSTVVVRSQKEITSTLKNIPKRWNHPDDIRCYVAFTKDPVTPDDVIAEVKLREGIDSIDKSTGVVYMTTKLEGITKSGFSKLSSTKVYKQITIRNLKTTQKILELINKD